MNPPAGCRFHPRCPWCFEVCPREMPPAIVLPDGGHARCWLNDPAVAGDRAEAFLRQQGAGIV
jgi:peptide/nickel transport system ATP-binding protein